MFEPDRNANCPTYGLGIAVSLPEASVKILITEKLYGEATDILLTEVISFPLISISKVSAELPTAKTLLNEGVTPPAIILAQVAEIVVGPVVVCDKVVVLNDVVVPVPEKSFNSI